MAHKHPVTDTDVRFILNPYTKVLRDTTPEAKTIMRGDHEAEVITVEMPRTIEGHDMTLCDISQVWFENGKNKSFDDIKDLQLSLEDDDTLIFSWKIPRRATQFVGPLSFMFYFACSEDDELTYELHTMPFARLSVKDHPVSKSDVDALQELIDEYIATITFSSLDTVSTIFTKSDNTVTETSEMTNGKFARSVVTFDESGLPVSVEGVYDVTDISVSYDEDGHPSALTINGTEHPIEWRGFEQFSKLGTSDTMLYNGAELPNIESVWADRKKDLPFAAIEDVSAQVEFIGSGSPYRLVLSRERVQLHSNSINTWNGIMFVDESGKAKFNYSAMAFGLSEDGKTWDDSDPGIHEASNSDQPFNYYPNLIWWSHDILKADGSAYLAASPDPTPVNPDLTSQQSFMVGYGIGLSGGENPVELKDGDVNG